MQNPYGNKHNKPCTLLVCSSISVFWAIGSLALQVQRAKIILLTADGLDNMQISNQAGHKLSESLKYLWFY